MEHERIKQAYTIPMMKMVPLVPGQVLCNSKDGLENYTIDGEETIE